MTVNAELMLLITENGLSGTHLDVGVSPRQSPALPCCIYSFWGQRDQVISGVNKNKKTSARKQHLVSDKKNGVNFPFL